MTVGDPRAEVAGQGAMENALKKLAPQNTDLIDGSKAADYLDLVRVHFPKGFEDQIWYAGVHDLVNHYVFYCFWNDIGPIECAQTILNKIGAE